MSETLRLRDVDVLYGPARGPRVSALAHVNLAVERGERVALVGRSGAGKSTIARLAVGLVEPAAGSVEVLGQQLGGLGPGGRRALRRRVQIVFQDPYQSLHPGLAVRRLVAEPLAVAGVERARWDPTVSTALERLGLQPAEQFMDRFPASLSGGQRQRVAIARAFVAHPELILADEPTSMLDASLRGSVAGLLLDLQRSLDATLVFITHDVALARYVADRVIVLAEGQVVEDRPTEELLADPHHPETQRLLAAARRLDRHIRPAATR